MNSQEALNQLDQLIERYSILKHPFYVAWSEGRLTREQLASYARAYYPHVAAFPGYIESALQADALPRARHELQQNLVDERLNPAPHHELWLDFAEALGLERGAVASSKAEPSAEQIVATFNRLSRESAGAALAGLYAYESQQPQVARVKADGLRQFYGIDSQPGTAYFDVHAETDLLHRHGERLALEECLENGASPAVILESAEEALLAYWGLLDGICELAQVPM